MTNNKKKKLFLIYFSLPIILVLFGIVLVKDSNRISDGLTTLFTKLGASVTYKCPAGYTLSGTMCYKCSVGTFDSNDKNCKLCSEGIYNSTDKKCYSNATYESNYCAKGEYYKGKCIDRSIKISPYKNSAECDKYSGQVSGEYITSGNYKGYYECFSVVANPGRYKCSSGSYVTGKPNASSGNYCKITPSNIAATSQKATSSSSGSTTTEYTVTFSTNGGILSDTASYTRKVTKGAKVGTLPTPTKSGYTFLGWFTTASGGTQITADTKVTSNVSYFAHWKVKSSGSGSGTGSLEPATPTKYKVTYCNDTNCSSKKTVTVTYGTKFNVLAYSTFTKTGYKNTKWKEIKNGSEVYWTIENTNNKNWKWNYKYNVTLYATWTPITYTVVFNKNNADATGTMSNETMTYGTKKALTANKFTYKGRKFVKWTTNKDGTGTTYSNSQSVVNLTSTQGKKINLYAQWAPITYTIAFNKNGGTGTAMSNMSKTFNVVKAAPECTYTKNGYVFSGWNTKADGSGKNYDEGANIGNLTNVNGSTHTLYAQWTVDNDVIPKLKSNKYIIRKLHETPTTVRKLKVFKNAKIYTGSDKKTQVGVNTKLKTGQIIDIDTNINYVTVVISDIDGDGELTISDISLCYEYFKKNISTKNEKFYAADINENGKIEIDDVSNIYQLLKGDGD